MQRAHVNYTAPVDYTEQVNETTNVANDNVRRFMWVRPKLYKKQLDAIFCTERWGIIEASTKAGKTVGCLAWILEQASLGKPGNNYWWVAPSYKQATIAFRRAKSGLTKGTFVPNESKLTLTLVNGTMIWFLSGEIPDNLYGEDVFAAVVDEASRLREEAWHAIRSTVTATGGPVRLIGNVHGRKNFFYRLARRAEAGEKNFHYAKIKADDAVAAGVLTQSEIDDAKAMLPEMVYRELYDAEPGEEAGNPFGLSHIKACTHPMRTGRALCYGVDLAKSTDYTVIIGLDAEGHCVYYERFQKPWKETIARIAEVCGTTSTLLDSTGVGDPIVENLAREHGSNFQGFNFSSKSKQQIMEGLSVAVQSHVIAFPKEVADEMEEFEYTYTGRFTVTYSAPVGFHDDCVCSLALSWQMFCNLAGAVGLLKYYEQRLALARSAEDGPPEPVKPPAVHPVPQVEETKPALAPIAAYQETIKRLQGGERCKFCKQALGNDRMTNGFESWHASCALPSWARPAEAPVIAPQPGTLNFADAV
jgi:hypothetical protein